MKPGLYVPIELAKDLTENIARKQCKIVGVMAFYTKSLELLEVAKCPDENCDEGIVSLHARTLGLPPQVSYAQCQFCHERSMILGTDDPTPEDT